MNPFDIEPVPMQFTKGAKIFATFVLIFIGLCLLFSVLIGTGTHDSVADTTAEETIIPDTTTENVTTETTDSVTSEGIDVVVTVPNHGAQPPLEETTDTETSEPEETLPPVEEPQNYVVLDETEKLIFATLIRLECGGSPYETKCAVASVVINRMKMWNISLRDVVFAKNQFSPAYLIDKTTGKSHYNPDKDGIYAQCWQAVEEVCANGPTIASYVFYFRSGHYHNWSTVVNYAQIGPMYFSYAPKYTKVCPKCNERFTKTEYPEHIC